MNDAIEGEYIPATERPDIGPEAVTSTSEVRTMPLVRDFSGLLAAARPDATDDSVTKVQLAEVLDEERNDSYIAFLVSGHERDQLAQFLFYQLNKLQDAGQPRNAVVAPPEPQILVPV